LAIPPAIVLSVVLMAIDPSILRHWGRSLCNLFATLADSLSR